jgi:hypothetical protein
MTKSLSGDEILPDNEPDKGHRKPDNAAWRTRSPFSHTIFKGSAHAASFGMSILPRAAVAVEK